MKTLKELTFLGVVISLLVLLTACPYASKVPIDKPSLTVDKQLIGKWVKYSEKKKEHPNYFDISDIGNHQYNICKFEYNKSDSSYNKSDYLAHITKIDDYKFLNMQKDGEGSYYLYRIDLQGNKFRLYEITDNIDETFNSSEELKQFVKKYMHLSFFYNKEEELYMKSK